jgi:hypothetical protein
MSRTLLLVALVAAALSPAAAQYEDEQTEDWAEQDRLYQERYLKKDQPAEPDPAQTHEEAEAAFLARVEELIKDRNYRAASSDHYRVQTDDPRLDPDPAVELLEAFRVYFDAFWSGRTDLLPYDKQSRVCLFYSFYKFNQLLEGDFRFNPQRPKGHYGSLFDTITLHTDADGPGNLPDTLVHEAAHQLVDRRFEWAGGLPPVWVSEGIATYFGFTYRDDDGFHPGKIGGKNISLLRDGKKSRGDGAAVRLREARNAMKDASSAEGSFVARLTGMEPSDFYGGNPTANYGAAWILVHYLFHGDEGAHADGFVRYLEQAPLGQADAGDLFTEIGQTPQELDANLARHVRKLKIL